jgi:hypothetical protein
MWVKFTMPVVIMVILGVFVMPVVIMVILGVFVMPVVIMVILGVFVMPVVIMVILGVFVMPVVIVIILGVLFLVVVFMIIMLIKHSAFSEFNFFQSVGVKQFYRCGVFGNILNWSLYKGFQLISYPKNQISVLQLLCL